MPRAKSIQSSLNVVYTRCRINRPAINFARNHLDHPYKTYNIYKTAARQTPFPEDISNLRRTRSRTDLVFGKIFGNVHNGFQRRLQTVFSNQDNCNHLI